MTDRERVMMVIIGVGMLRTHELRKIWNGTSGFRSTCWVAEENCFQIRSVSRKSTESRAWISCIATVCGNPWVNCIRHFSCKLERASKAIWPFFLLLKKEDKLVLGLQAAAGGKTESVKTRSVVPSFQGGKLRRQLRRKTCWPGTSWLKMPWWKRISTWKPPPLLSSWVRATKRGSLEGSSKISY